MVARSGDQPPAAIKQTGAIPATKPVGHARRVDALPPCGRAMIDLDCLPIIGGRGQRRHEDPPRRLRIEAGIVAQPMANVFGRAADKNGDARDPPAVDLEWPKIVRSVGVCDGSPDPSALLISQTPKGLFQPGLTGRSRPNAAGDPQFLGIHGFRSCLGGG